MIDLVKASAKQSVFWIFISSALVVIGLRSVAPIDLIGDKAMQIEAAHRLANGQGLVCSAFVDTTQHDISSTAYLKNLTWYPPLYSLIFAGMFSLGVPYLIADKLFYALVSLFGWIGWATLATMFLNSNLHIGRFAIPFPNISALILPIFFTPNWSFPTDPMLWAVASFFLLSFIHYPNSLKSAFICGVLAGLMINFRYQAAFLIVAGILVIGFQVRGDIKKFVFQIAVFVGSALILILPLAWYIVFFGGGIDQPKADGISFWEKLVSQLPHLYGGLRPFTFGLPETQYVMGRAIPFPLQLLIFAFLLLLPLILHRLLDSRVSDTDQAKVVTACCLPVGLYLFLLLPSVSHNYAYIAYPRMYTSTNLCAFFILYFLATEVHLNIPKAWKFYRAGIVLVLAFNVGYQLFRPFFFLSPPLASQQNRLTSDILSYYPRYSVSYPSTEIIFRSNIDANTLFRLRQLTATYSDAVIYTEGYGWEWCYPFETNFAFRAMTPINTKNYTQQLYTTTAKDVFFLIRRTNVIYHDALIKSGYTSSAQLESDLFILLTKHVKEGERLISAN